MPLAPRTRLGPYEVIDSLGAGGMGEVYRARDSRLDRTVAIKVLPGDVAGDPPARERFEREARAVAALNHPNICTLHDIGRHGEGSTAIDFFVMEYLEGETLAARLQRGPLSFVQALSCAAQIASALDRAHRAGIVHRDIKPANIMLAGGTGRDRPPEVKLLDFGIAKSQGTTVGGGLETTGRLRQGLTDRGLILGTVQYMAPEQLEGGVVDARTDIFALGAVLYEMVTGRRAFVGDSHASVIAAILQGQPPRLAATEPLAPPSLDRLVAMCLEKHPDDRWQSARDVELQLRHLDTETITPTRAEVPARRLRERVAWLTAAAGLVTAVVIAATAFPRTPPPRLPIRFIVPPPDGQALSGPVATVQATQLALSADGRQLAFVASSNESPSSLWVRDLDDTTPRLVRTSTADVSYPFWSPDGRTIGYFANAKLMRVDVDGGAPQTLCDAPEPRGGTWNREGLIVFAFSNSGALSRIPAAGGEPVAATTLDHRAASCRTAFPSSCPTAVACSIARAARSQPTTASMSRRSARRTPAGSSTPGGRPPTRHRAICCS